MPADYKPRTVQTKCSEHLVQGIQVIVERETLAVRIHATAETKQIRNNKRSILRQPIEGSAERFAAGDQPVQKNKDGLAGSRVPNDKAASLDEVAAARSPLADRSRSDVT